jgi:hypothetical protein
MYNGQDPTTWANAGLPLVTDKSYLPPCMRQTVDCSKTNLIQNADMTTFCPWRRTSVIENAQDPAERDPIIVNQQKDPPTDAKCGSVANERGIGGAASVAKDCSRHNKDIRQRRHRRLRGI